MLNDYNAIDIIELGSICMNECSCMAFSKFVRCEEV